MKSNLPLLVAEKEAEEIRANKRDSRYSQKEIAEAVGLSESVVSRYMNNKIGPEPDYLTTQKFAIWLGVSVDKVITVIEDE